MRVNVAAFVVATVLAFGIAPTAGAVGPGANESDMLVMHQLPAWVQVTGSAVPLYAADAGSSPTAQLADSTFLHVLGGGAARLRVEVYDADGEPSRGGWVDPTDVLPSAPGVDWLVSARTTSLYATAQAGAATVRSLDPFTPMQQLDNPQDDRVEVRVYRADFGGATNQGWVDAADLGPALPPHALVIASDLTTSGAHGPSGARRTQAFIDSAASAARAAGVRTGVPVSVTVAQAILESDWGRSALAQEANNYFGIKAMGSLGSDGVVWLPTAEVDGAGQLYDTISPFRAYRSLAESTLDHDRLLQLLPRYAPAMQLAQDPKQFAAQLYACGYSTDPEYADKLVDLMDTYDLYRLDG